MKKVFISQPMAGKTNEEIKEERSALEGLLELKGYSVVDSIIAETPEEAFNEPVYYLGQSILLLSQSDVVVFMKGWEKARGCKIEHDIALAYNVPILYDEIVSD